MTEPVVTLAHLRRLDYCKTRILEWCKEYGIPARRFCRNVGVPVSEVRATGCAFAIAAADLAEREASQ